MQASLIFFVSGHAQQIFFGFAPGAAVVDGVDVVVDGNVDAKILNILFFLILTKIQNETQKENFDFLHRLSRITHHIIF